MADEKKRIINETTDTALASSGDYVIVDSQTEGTRKFDLGAALAGKVDTVSGKGLSTNDYTTEEKTKLAGIATGATNVTVDNTLSNSGQAADAKATGDEITQLKEDLNHYNNSYNLSWSKGLISAADGTIVTTANGATSSKTPGPFVTIVDNWKAVVGFYKNDIYLGKLNPAQGIDKTGGSWGYITGTNDLTALMQSVEADSITIGIIPPTGTTITVDTASYYGNTICYVQTKLNGDVTKEEIEPLNDFVFNDIIAPIEIIENTVWYSGDNPRTIQSAGSTLKKYSVVDGVEYYASTAFLGAETGFPLIAYFNSNNEYLSYEYMNVAGNNTIIKNQLLTIPANASWFYVNSRNTESHVDTIGNPSMNVHEIIKAIPQEKELRILFVGNSLTQDGIAYLPYLLKTYYPDIRFKFYMYYNGGYALAQQYNQFVEDFRCDIFSIAENTSSWTNTSLKMSEVLSTYTFDIVCLQEYFNYKETYGTADIEDWKNCRNYIQSHYTGGNGLEFISLFHAPLRANAETVFNLTKTGNALILKDTISEDMIPIGMAVYDALSTDLDNLGDSGHLSPDGTHTQEGLPCLLQTYTALLWVFDKLTISKSIYGLPFKMTTAIYNTINVPGPNLGTGVIEGTDAQNLLAQEVAIKAYKEGKKFVASNIA